MSNSPFPSKRRRNSSDSPTLSGLIKKRTRSYSDSSVFLPSSPESLEMSSDIALQIAKALKDPTVIDNLCKTLVESIMPKISEILDDKLSVFSEKVNKNENDIKTLQDKVDVLKEELATKDKQVDELYQYGRRNNIRVYGIPEERNENTDKLILDLSTKMGVQLKLEDLDRTHRTGDPTKYSKAKPRPIMVKFLSYRSKRDVMSNVSKLKNHTPKVFINDDLTKERARLSTEARQLVSSKKLAGTWARDGIVYVKKLDGSVHLIKTRDEFTKLTESLRLRMRFKVSQGPRDIREYTDAEDSDY